MFEKEENSIRKFLISQAVAAVSFKERKYNNNKDSLAGWLSI